MMSQARQPIGVPSGGQFAPQQHAEPATELDPEHAEATFDFPADDRTADQALAFWSRVPVSDGALTTLVVSYRRVRAEALNQHMTQWDRTYPRPNVRSKIMGSDKTPPEQLAAWQAARNQAQVQFESAHPPRIPDTQARQIARVGRMLLNSRTMPPQEQQRLMASTFRIGGQQVPVGQIVHQYLLDRLGLNDYTTTDVTTLREIANLNSTIREVTAAVNNVQDEVHRNTLATTLPESEWRRAAREHGWQ